MPPPQLRRGLGLDSERVVGPDTDKIEMQFAVDQIQPIAARLRQVVLLLAGVVGGLRDNRAALFALGVEPGGDGELLFEIPDAVAVIEVGYSARVVIELAVEGHTLSGWRSDHSRRAALETAFHPFVFCLR